MKVKQNDNSKFKYQTCANKETYTEKNCAGMELNGQFLKSWKSFVILVTQ